MPPTSTQSATRPRLDVERLELANGLVVLLSENHATPAVAIKAVVAAGSRYETDEQAGLASLVGEMIDEGTTTRSARQIAETIEAVGGKLGTYGDYQESGVVAMFLSQDLGLGLEITADLLMNATFPEDKVQQQRARRLAQLKSRLDLPRTLASDIFNDIVFSGTPQHRPAVGHEATVKNLTRGDMAAFYHRFYTPNNTLLAIVGDIDKAAVLAQVEAAFGAWPASGALALPAVEKPARQHQAIERFIAVPKEQVNIFIGHGGIERRNPDYYTLLVLDTILGSSPGFTSRIPRILRDEMGLAYTTYSNITSSAGLDPGRFVAYIGTSPDNLQLALAGLRNEIERIVKEPVTSEEVELAADYLTGSFVFHFQKSLQIADFLADAETYGLGFDYLERYPQLIRAVTVEDVWRVARAYIDPEHLTTVVVGPLAET
ncbi:MAG TPA: pitrilysin family protein [Blastocatellia bacterium]|nr:pitrilysin family protein [Blastocatellia bacterium]